MARIIKKEGKKIEAYELGGDSLMLDTMIIDRKIKSHGDGTYELITTENVGTGHGELAKVGDFFKVDGHGNPYPNAREWFLSNHRHIEGDTYEQLPKPLEAWEATEEITDAIQWLVDGGKLVLDPNNEAAYFNAELWGAPAHAARNAVVVFYGVEKDEAGNITAVDFNFVERSEFERTYNYCE